VCDGFIGNRILYVYREAANFMMEDGASPYQIDQALERFGYAMGPFRTADLTGGDIGWATRKRKAATRPPEARYVRVADRLCERGWFGQKTGRGYYRYPERGQRGQHDPEVLALIDDERAARGIAARPFSDEEIVRRYMAALVNEAAKVLEDGIALRPADIDAALVNGYGFPRWRGGPMKYADDAGLPAILADLESYAKEDPAFWAPSELLRRLAREGSTFGKLNRQP
jgi:3-hydroxyacyl-CoA dehydrogenase